MGNTAPQCRCRDAGTVAGTGGKLSKNVAKAAAPAAIRFVAVTHRKQPDDEERTVRRRAGVPPEGAGEGAPPATTAVTVKVVMRRKDAAALATRLKAQSARQRKARMAELKRELRAGAGGGCGGVRPEACQDSWRPRLALIPENKCSGVLV